MIIHISSFPLTVTYIVLSSFRPGFLFMLPWDRHKKFTWTFFEGKSEGQRAPDSHGALYIILAVKGGGCTALSCSVQALKQLIFALRMPLCQRQSSQVIPARSPADRRKGPLAPDTTWHLHQAERDFRSQQQLGAWGHAVK